MTAADPPSGAGHPTRGPDAGGVAAPVILHTGKRTGGTALAAALRGQPGLHLWFDPLNPALAQPFERWSVVRPSDWRSGHPQEMGPYFAEFAAAVAAGEAPPVVIFDPAWAVLRAGDEHPALAAYLEALFAAAARAGRRAVLKGEQTEGMIPWLRARFPEAVHIGLVRAPADQFASWLDQLTLHDNPFFFHYAQSLVEADPGRFGLADAPPLRLDDADALHALFLRVEGVLGPLRAHDTDLALDISPGSPEPVTDQCAALEALLGEGAPPFVAAVRQVRERSPAADRGALDRFRAVGEVRARLGEAEGRAAALAEACAELDAARGERDALRAERDAEVARRDQAGRERDEAREQVQALDRRLAGTRASLAAATAAARAASGASQVARQGLVAQRDAARAEAVALRAGLADARAAQRAGATALAQLQASRSWRLTAPLRAVAAAVRRAVGRARGRPSG